MDRYGLQSCFVIMKSDSENNKKLTRNYKKSKSSTSLLIEDKLSALLEIGVIRNDRLKS